jgi:hypothetical protein
MEPQYKGADCICPKGVVTKQSFTSGYGQLAATSTNPAIQYSVTVGDSFFALNVKVPIGEEEGELQCEESARRSMGPGDTLSNRIDYALRQAKEWTASVEGERVYACMCVCVCGWLGGCCL